jgi:hypothetical protein
MSRKTPIAVRRKKRAVRGFASATVAGIQAQFAGEQERGKGRKRTHQHLHERHQRLRIPRRRHLQDLRSRSEFRRPIHDRPPRVLPPLPSALDQIQRRLPVLNVGSCDAEKRRVRRSACTERGEDRDDHLRGEVEVSGAGEFLFEEVHFGGKGVEGGEVGAARVHRGYGKKR